MKVWGKISMHSSEIDCRSVEILNLLGTCVGVNTKELESRTAKLVNMNIWRKGQTVFIYEVIIVYNSFA